MYTDYKTELKENLCIMKLENIVTVNNTNSSLSCQNSVKLPRITIPTFSGQYAEWPSFKDLYVSLIHNNPTLQNVQKLHYLKSYLTGEAEQLLRHLSVTSDNYLTCWNLLEQRFNNKKHITDCILKRFFSQKV